MENVTPILQIANKYTSKVKKFESGTTGHFLEYEELDIKELCIPDLYQRDLSPTEINKHKKFNKLYYTPIIVSKRPNGTNVVVDGQHRLLMAYYSEHIDKLACIVLKHVEGTSIEKCEKVEAEIFHALNAKRKNPSHIDKMRAGYICGLNEAIVYNDNLNACKVFVDCLGDLNGLELCGEYQWRQSIKKYELSRVMKACDIAKDLDKIWNKRKVRGDIVYGLSAIVKFMEDASDKLNGRKNKLLKFILTEMPKSKPKIWYEGISGSKTDVLIARRIISAYNSLSTTAKSQCISEDTLDFYNLADPTK